MIKFTITIDILEIILLFAKLSYFFIISFLLHYFNLPINTNNLFVLPNFVFFALLCSYSKNRKFQLKEIANKKSFSYLCSYYYAILLKLIYGVQFIRETSTSKPIRPGFLLFEATLLLSLSFS